MQALLAAHLEAVQAADAAADACPRRLQGTPAEPAEDSPAALHCKRTRRSFEVALVLLAFRCPQLVGAAYSSLLHRVLSSLPMVRAGGGARLPACLPGRYVPACSAGASRGSPHTIALAR